MKRKLLALFISILSVVLFTGCSCMSLSVLSFTTAFNGGDSSNNATPMPNYYEKLTYKVELVKNGASYDKSDLIYDEILNYDFSDGEFVTELKVLPSVPQLKTNIKISDNECIYEFKTKLSINVKYDEFTHNDVIESLTYFCPAPSYAPLYSKTYSNYTLFSFNQNDKVIENVESTGITEYSKNNYTLTTDIKTFDVNGKEISSSIKTNTFKYDYKTVIDNSELIFLLRNLSVAKGTTVSVPTVSPSFGEYKPLAISIKNEFIEKYNFIFNDNPIDEELGVIQYRFFINETKTTGNEKYAYIQKEGTNDLTYKSLLLKYEEPAIAYGTYEKLGTLVYTLTNASYNN